VTAVVVLLFAAAGVLLLVLAGLNVGGPHARLEWLGLACLAIAVVLIPAINALGGGR
jgi:hypothetical protein